MFPDSIDKLQKERSKKDGMKPIIVEGSQEFLFSILLGIEKLSTIPSESV